MKKTLSTTLLFLVHFLAALPMDKIRCYEQQKTISKVYDFIIDYQTPLFIDLSESESDVNIVSEPIVWPKSPLIPEGLYSTKWYEYVSTKTYNIYHACISLLAITAHKNKRCIRAEAYYSNHTAHLADKKEEFTFILKEGTLCIKPLIHKKQIFSLRVPSDSPLVVKAIKNINYTTCYGVISTQQQDPNDYHYSIQKDDIVKNISDAYYAPPSISLYTKRGTIMVQKVSQKELCSRLKK